jgi:hypothetical protein
MNSEVLCRGGGGGVREMCLTVLSRSLSLQEPVLLHTLEPPFSVSKMYQPLRSYLNGTVHQVCYQ